MAADAVPPAPAFDWSGAYGGLEVGYGFGSAAHSFSNGAPSDNSNPQGFLGGGYLGYNFQKGNLLFGVEADVALASISGRFNNTTGFTSSGTSQLNNQEDLRLRIGMPQNRLLPYLAGGLALGSAHFGGGPSGGPCCGYDASLTGFTLGGGIDYAISDHLATRLEYRYTNFGTASAGLAPTFPTVIMPVSLQTSEVMFGLTYKF